ncbi:MAG: beta-lactamase family protein, partial [Deltaproteobacteria bacterium]
QPFERDTLVNVYSTTKGLTALALHRLVDEGKVDLDAPVARYWPEFAQAGKEKLPVRYLLSHEAGLPAVKKPLPLEALFDWHAMTSALAEQEPWWEPGKAHGYHALTFGWLVGEVVRRVRGKSLGDVVREEIARPLGAEFEIGFGPELDARVASLQQGPIHPPQAGGVDFDLERAVAENPEGVLAKTFANPPALMPGRFRARTDIRTRTPSRASTRRSRTAAARSACACSRARRSSARARSRSTAATRSCRCRRASRSDSSCRRRTSRSARIRARSATAARAARTATPTRSTGSRSATR